MTEDEYGRPLVQRGRLLEVWSEHRWVDPLSQEEIEELIRTGYLEERLAVNEGHWVTNICVRWATPQGKQYGQYVTTDEVSMSYAETIEVIPVLLDRFSKSIEGHR